MIIYRAIANSHSLSNQPTNYTVAVRKFINKAHNRSVYKGEPLFVLLGLLTCQQIGRSQSFLPSLVALQSGLHVNPASRHSCDASPQSIDLEIVDCPIKLVQLFAAEMTDEVCQWFADMVFENVVDDFGRLLDVIVESGEDSANKLEGVMIDVVDGDLVSFFQGLCLLDVFHDGGFLWVEFIRLSLDDDYYHLIWMYDWWASEALKVKCL